MIRKCKINSHNILSTQLSKPQHISGEKNALIQKSLISILEHGQLTLASSQMSTQPLSHFLLNRTREKIRWKSLWTEIKTGTSLTSYHHGQNRLNIIPSFPAPLPTTLYAKQHKRMRNVVCSQSITGSLRLLTFLLLQYESFPRLQSLRIYQLQSAFSRDCSSFK